METVVGFGVEDSVDSDSVVVVAGCDGSHGKAVMD